MAMIGALGALVQGGMGLMQGMYQAKVAGMNAKIAGQNASLAIDKSRIEAQDNDMRTSADLGEQEVAQAASGIALSGKSQILTRRATRLLGRRDSTNIIYGGKVEEHNYLVQKANFKAEQGAAKLSGISSAIGGVMSAVGSLPSGSFVGGSTSIKNPERFIPKPVLKPDGFNPRPNLLRPRASRPTSIPYRYY